MAALLAKALAIAVFIHAPCPSDTTMDPAYGSACTVAPITIYVAGPLPHQTYMHELGHVIDHNLLTDQDRGTFLYLIHSRRAWLSEPNSPHERFAVAFALCERNAQRLVGHDGGGYGYSPSTRTHRRICGWMAGLARDN